jgi:Ca2+-binding RTX toxin-like protein
VIVAANGVSTIENVVGSQTFGDTLSGDARANRLIGLGGDDIIEGREGNDVLVGGLGGDQLYGDEGEDNLAGEDGNDLLVGGGAKDLLAGGIGDDTLRGEAGEDVLSGGEGVDVLYGGDDDDLIGGEAGNDWLYGESGNDQMAGGEGNDTLYGGDGNDEILGESGNDTLHGEAGNDTYFFDRATGSDVVVDASGANRIALGGVTRQQVWLTRSGDHLVIGVIGVILCDHAAELLRSHESHASPGDRAERGVAVPCARRAVDRCDDECVIRRAVGHADERARPH